MHAACLKHALERRMAIFFHGQEAYAAFDDGIDYSVYKLEPGSAVYSVRKHLRWCSCPVHEECKHILGCREIFGQAK